MFDYGKQSCGKLLNGNIVNVVRLGYDVVARHGAMANEIFLVRFSFVQGFCVPYCIVKKNNYFAFGFVGRFCYRFLSIPVPIIRSVAGARIILY